MKTRLLSLNALLLWGLVIGILTGFFAPPPLIVGAETMAEVMMNLLRLISVPLIFLSIVATVSGMGDIAEVKSLGARVFKYTLMTTLVAASVALGLFLLIDPVGNGADALLAAAERGVEVPPAGSGASYLSFLVKIVPPSLGQVFTENNVLGALFLAVMLSFAILTLPKEQKESLHKLFATLFAALLQVTQMIAKVMPLAVWAFVTLFVVEIKESTTGLSSIGLYVATVLAANLIQGLIILPLFLKWKGIPPARTLRGMLPALTFAFFSKSSSSTLPVAMECAQKRLGVSPRIAGVTLPLCTTINMNACAAFILITVLFVGGSYGMVFSNGEMVAWIAMATVAAIGNAGVPMGCYFLASAFLASMNVPLYFMGIILPIYSVIDMVETALNVWSDSCIAVVVDKEVTAAEQSTEIPVAETLQEV